MGPEADPLASVREVLARAAATSSDAPASRVAVQDALVRLDALRASARTPFEVRRVLAHRSEALAMLGRADEAAVAYAEALELDLSNAEEILDGVGDLLDRFGALEAVVAIVPKAVAAHPGRRWQFEPLAARARERMCLERAAALAPADLERVRTEVARRLASRPPCDHGDDARPVARAVLEAMGCDAPRVLAWLADLGACCCDCAVASVRGPRERRCP